MVISLAAHKRIVGELRDGPSSIQAHYIKTAGSKFLLTACGVALLRSTATGATSATMRCFECQEVNKVKA